MPQLTVHNAQVSTATVEIKTLTISGKQVTLAVFRQLQEELLVAEDGTLNGVPWGRVNYCPGKCADVAEHWHVVWQQGDELRRASVPVAYRPERVFWSESLGRHHAASVYQWLTSGDSEYWHGGVFDLFSGKLKTRHGITVDCDYSRKAWVKETDDVIFTDERTGVRVGFDISQEVKDAVLAVSAVVDLREAWHKAQQREAEAERDLEEAREDLNATGGGTEAPTDHDATCTCRPCCQADPQKARGRVFRRESVLESAKARVGETSPQSPAAEKLQGQERGARAVLGERYAAEPLDRLWAAYRAELDDEAARRERHANVRKAIADLPQLFIAV
jgi:hypothetical protein